ncbi:MAG: phosphatase PAP2 family protein [Bdellovibrionota bacterium]
MKIFFFLIILLSFTSCSFLNRRGNWGKKAIWPLKSSNIWDAAKRNALSPHVWVPLAGAGTIHWSGWDHKISNWANAGRGLYDDQTAADNWSDNFNNILKYEAYATTLLTPSMNDDGKFSGYLMNKAKGALVVNAAGLTSSFGHERLVKAAHRRRPNRADYRSFPSGHSTDAAARNMVNSKNLDHIDMSDDLRLGIKSANTLMASGTLWARLEGKRHFPSDVLCGYALGSFLSGFVYDALLNMEPNESFVVAPAANGKMMAQYSLSF